MAALAPFVWSIRYSIPSSKNKNNYKTVTKRHILNLLDYSAHKEEVVLENEKLKEYSPESNLLDELIFTEYLDKRPGSHGLFSEDDSVNLEAIKNEIVNHEGIIWYGFFSLREDEAVRINHIDRDAWETTLRKSFPTIAEKINIPESNFRWVAAYHEAKGHPHCHYLFWEKDPERERGVLSSGEKNDIRKALIRNIYENERERLGIEKTFYRDAVRNGVKDILGLKRQLKQEEEKLKAEIGDKPTIPPRISLELKTILGQELNNISKILPGHGRAALKLMPTDVKESIKGLSDWILQQPSFREEMDKYLEAHLAISKVYTSQESQLNYAKDNAYNDLRDRIAQDLLKAAVQLQREERQNQFEQLNIYNSIWRGLWITVQMERSKSEYQARLLENEREQEERDRKRREGRSR